MLTSANLLTNGVGCKVSVGCKNNITKTAVMPGFGALGVLYDGPVNGGLADNVLTLGASSLAGANGTFIRNLDNKVTFGVAVKGGFIVSDQFGGCDLTILRNPAGEILGAHVYSSTDCRDCVANPPAKWTVIGTWKSNGYQAKWNTTALLAFAFIEGNQIRVVVVGTKGYPLTVTNVELAKTFDL